MLQTEIVARVEAAERHLQDEVFDLDLKSLTEVWDTFKTSSTLPTEAPAPVLLRLASVLRKLAKGMLEDNEDHGALRALAQEILVKSRGWYPKDIDLLNELGSLYYDTAQYDKAVSLFNLVLSHQPSAPQKVLALRGSGAALRELRSFAEAEDMFVRVANPGVRTLIERGWLRFYKELFDLALADFNTAHAQAAPTAKVDLHDAKVGQIASLIAMDALDPAKLNSAQKQIDIWRAPGSGTSAAEVVKILLDSGAIHIKLNLYPAVLLNYDLLLDVDGNNEDGWSEKMSALKWLRRFKEAEELYPSAQARVPDSLKIWKEMGNLLYEQKRFREAYSYYSGEALKDPIHVDRNKQPFINNLKNDLEANEWTVVLLRRMRNLGDARKKTDDLLAKHPQAVDFICEKAIIEYTEHNYDSAIQLFDRALRLKEYNEFALQWRAASYRKKRDFDKARAEIEEALKKRPASTGLWEERAWLAFDQEDLENAGKFFDKAIDADPYLIPKRFRRVEIFARLNQWDDALEVFDKLDQEFPDDAEVGEQLCWFYLRLGRPEAAEKLLESLKEQYPDNVMIINVQGGCELERRNYAAAETTFRRVLEKVDYEPQYYINLAWALLRQVKEPGEMWVEERNRLIEEARTSCRKALRLDPFNAKAYACLGVIAYKRNAYPDAESYFRKSIEMSPSEGSHVELAALYCQMGRYDEATTKLGEAIRINKNDARAYIELGNVHVLKENNKEAVRQCREAVIVEPNSADAHRALAIALMRSEKYDEAEATIRKALRIVAPTRRWQLYLLLSQVLIHRGDSDNKDRKKKDLELYEEALRCVSKAQQHHPLPNADIFFHAGVAHYKLEDFPLSRQSFANCLKSNSERFEAQRYGSIVEALMEQDRRLFNMNSLYGLALATICIVMLAGLWLGFYLGYKRTILKPATATADSPAAPGGAKAQESHEEFAVDASLLTVMTPILLGLVVVAALLPNLNKLKLPGGFEAEIHEPKPPDSSISSGPRGEVGFGGSLPIVSPEPR